MRAACEAASGLPRGRCNLRRVHTPKSKVGGSSQTRFKRKLPAREKTGRGNESKGEKGEKQVRRRLKKEACDALNEGVNKYVSRVARADTLSVFRHGQKLILHAYGTPCASEAANATEREGASTFEGLHERRTVHTPILALLYAQHTIR